MYRETGVTGVTALQVMVGCECDVVDAALDFAVVSVCAGGDVGDGVSEAFEDGCDGSEFDACVVFVGFA